MLKTVFENHYILKSAAAMAVIEEDVCDKSPKGDKNVPGRCVPFDSSIAAIIKTKSR
jgi:hypothetical protein